MVAYVIWATNFKSEVRFDLWGRLEAAVASEPNKGTKDWSQLPKIHVHIAYMFWASFEALLVASEATTASKRPRRSDLTSDLEFVAQIAYATMFVWAV